MYNLVQIQDKLKSIPNDERGMAALIAYANGQSTIVPPYIALSELNRRKEMEQEAMASQAPQGEPPTVLDQTEQGIMQLAQGQQPQQMPQQPQGMPQGMPQQQPQGMPQQQAPIQAAHGGLMHLPVDDGMFRKEHYAKGGIVAFAGDTDGSQVPDVSDEDLQKFDQAQALFEAERAAQEAQKQLKDQQPVSSKDLMANLLAQANKTPTIEDIAAEQKRSKELAGVSATPFAQSQERFKNIEGLYKQQAENRPMNELISLLGGIAKAKPNAGVGVALGEGADARQAMVAKNDEIARSQQEHLYAWQRADEKEQDAIARGDAKGILEAKQEKDKLAYNVAKLSYDKDNLAFTKFQAMLTQDPLIRGYVKQREDDNTKPGTPKWKKFDELIENRTKQLAESAGFDYKMASLKSVEPVVPPEKLKEESVIDKVKGVFSSNKKEDKKDTGIPANLPAGTTYFDRTSDGKPIYLLPNGKKVVQE